VHLQGPIAPSRAPVGAALEVGGHAGALFSCFRRRSKREVTEGGLSHFLESVQAARGIALIVKSAITIFGSLSHQARARPRRVRVCRGAPLSGEKWRSFVHCR